MSLSRTPTTLFGDGILQLELIYYLACLLEEHSKLTRE